MKPSWHFIDSKFKYVKRYLNDLLPTAQVVHALTHCKPVSFAGFSVIKDKEK